MWKSDLPPSYEESRNHQYSHQHGTHPQPPGYGYPAYGVQPQPGMPYPGQPQSGIRQGPGYPSSGFPSIIPTFLSSPLPNTNTSHNMGDTEGFASGVWDSRAVRHAFIRKVYLILAAQLIFTVSIVAVFVFVHPVRLFVVQNPGVYWASFAIYFVTYLVLVCCEGPRRRFPWNLILLSVFTLAMSYMTGTISSYYDTKAVFLALIITAIVCVIVTIFCFQTKVDFTSCTGLFFVLGMVVLVTGIITSIVLSFQYVPWLHMLYASIGAVVYTLFLAYHTQLLMGNRSNTISPEDYIFGALSLYVDIVQIFLFLLQLTGSSSD
ncbi:protein lifeguard 3 [Clupea harengus]|uniref:Protein lifeguard 3 n=1 Tax=Clupea harengus TaxID=7950 RepID=A0A6P8G6L4_CLUHA|nr:protein lifeguard 3 [Clupea harengus]